MFQSTQHHNPEGHDINVVNFVYFNFCQDLYSVMIRGPEKTPYEDGLFFFDFQLSADYPKAPPLCHYISYCSDRLNPNLYEDGKVCVSLLGTWSGKGTEVWTLHSNLLQVIVSIQGKFKGSTQLGVTSCTQTWYSRLTRTFVNLTAQVLSETEVSVTIHWSPFVRCSVYNKPTITCVHSSNQTKHNINNSINASACDTTAPEPTLLLTGIHCLLVISI